MSEIKSAATRAGFGKALVELGAKRDDFVVLDADLAGATMTKGFAAAYPERFFDCGIAEGGYDGYCGGHCGDRQKGSLQLLCYVCGGTRL